MDLRDLPRLPKRQAFEYLERVRIEQDGGKVVAENKAGRSELTPLRTACLLLGPGATITHAATAAVSKAGCSILWVGQEGVRMYACGQGGSRSSSNAMAQATQWADPLTRMAVVRRLYELRFKEPVIEGRSLQQLRGQEGARVRITYKKWSEETGVPWNGRSSMRRPWNEQDPVNKALGVANSCLYGVCHAALVSCGFLPSLGFIHTGEMLSFVYDIADLYKTEVTIPVAFEAAKSGVEPESLARDLCRTRMRVARLLNRVVPDVYSILGRSL